MRDLINKVNEWARENSFNNYFCGSRMSYCKDAFYAGIISEDELDALRSHYGNLWDYVGD